MNEAIQNHTATLHRTKHYSDEQVQRLQQSANQQYRRIAREFFRRPGKALGPTRIHAIMFPGFPDKRGDWAITSTRRAINNLTEDGFLMKTKQTADSLLNGVEHLWTWRDPLKHPRTHREMIMAQKEHGQMNFYEQMFGGK